MSTPGTHAQLPDLARSDARFVVARNFSVPRAEMQRQAADALLDAWDDIAWPQGLLSISVFLGTDGVTLFHYVQWTHREAFAAYIASGDPGPAPYIVANAFTRKCNRESYDLARLLRLFRT